MKKILSILLILIITAACFAGCGAADNDRNTETKNAADAKDGGLKIVTTIFPEYDWVKSILGENPSNADVTLLLDNGVDLHSYQPTAEDILKISECDVFIYVGGESDEWVDDALKEATNRDMKVIDLLNVLGDSVKEEELVEGMEEHEHEHEEDHDAKDDESADDEHEHETEYDEHVWLSLKSTMTLINSISEAISSADNANRDLYSRNAQAYIDELRSLDEEYTKAVDSSSVKTLVFGDRFPFRYMTDDYDLTYYAAFPGCSAETEASFETVKFLADKVDELSLKYVMTIEGTDHRIAETIIQTTKNKDQEILVMDSMQSVTGDDIDAGASYLNIMKDNLEVLKKALS